MITYKSFIQLALKDGNTISVFDGEEWATKRSVSYADIISAIDSVELSEIRIRDKDDNYLGWAMIIPTEQGDEDISDYSANDYMENLWNTWQGE